MAEQLDINQLNSGFKNIIIGRLSKDIISLLNLNREECDIILWEDRFKYVEKHIQHFKSKEDYEKHIASIPDIIENPDYVGKHPKNNSIQYIKRIGELMIVAIRIKKKGNMAFRSAYPLSEEQLKDYIKSGTVFELKNDVDNQE